LNHSEAVTKHYIAAENAVEDGYWDDVFRETSYYENDVSPHPPRPDRKGKEVGEFDVLLVNYDDQVAMYKELKTSRGDMKSAKKQLDRAEEFFEDEGWKILKNSALEN